jgi:hypothetical protein
VRCDAAAALGEMIDATLTDSRWLRLSSFTAFYAAQGIPIGPCDLRESDAMLGQPGRQRDVEEKPAKMSRKRQAQLGDDHPRPASPHGREREPVHERTLRPA